MHQEMEEASGTTTVPDVKALPRRAVEICPWSPRHKGARPEGGVRAVGSARLVNVGKRHNFQAVMD